MKPAQVVTLGLGLIASMQVKAETLSLGSPFPKLILEGKDGGKLDGSSWSTAELPGKAWSLFYVDPDEKDLNKDAQEALKAKKIPVEKLRSLAMINMAATVIPNFLISGRIEKSQKEYPNTVYVKDLNKVGVKTWGLADDSSNVVIIGPDGQVKYFFKGKLPPDEIQKMIEAVEKTVAEMP